MNTPIPEKSPPSTSCSSLYGAGLGILLTFGCVAAVAQQPATIRQILAGTMLPGLEVATFEHSETLYPFSRVPRKGPVRSLPLASNQLKNVRFRSGGKNYDLFDYLADNRIAGLLILKGGKVAFEDYELGATPSTRWASFSMAKSVSSTLVGAAVQQGLISSLDFSLSRYVPTLKGGGYDEVTIRNLLQMASGVKWDETYTDPESDVSKLGLLLLAQRPGAVVNDLREHAERNELITGAVGKLAEQDAVGHAEDGGRGPDTEGNRQHSGHGKAGGPSIRTDGELQILEEGIEVMLHHSLYVDYWIKRNVGLVVELASL